MSLLLPQKSAALDGLLYSSSLLAAKINLRRQKERRERFSSFARANDIQQGISGLKADISQA